MTNYYVGFFLDILRFLSQTGLEYGFKCYKKWCVEINFLIFQWSYNSRKTWNLIKYFFGEKKCLKVFRPKSARNAPTMTLFKIYEKPTGKIFWYFSRIRNSIKA